MSTETASMTTSTPKEAKAKVLRENFFNFSTIPGAIKAEKFKRPHPMKKNFPKKENSNRSNQRRPRNHDINEDYMEKRRQQAIEAMKIAEQRRLRLAQEESTEDESIELSMANLSVTSVEYLPDGRLKLSRKELAARHDKHRRIQEQLAQQEARKKTEEMKKTARRLSYKPKTFPWTPRAVFKTAPTRHMANRECCKRAQKKTVEMKDGETQVLEQDVLRYKKDELRDMNPYGFFFM